MSDKVTPKKRAEEWRPAFLDALTETANVSESCKKAGISRQTAYRHRRAYEGFANEWDEALGMGVGTLEDEAVRRARDGVEESVFYKGEIVGQVRKYSDTLLIFLLKSHKPDTYRERREITGFIQTDDVTELTPGRAAERMEQILKSAEKRREDNEHSAD